MECAHVFDDNFEHRFVYEILKIYVTNDFSITVNISGKKFMTVFDTIKVAKTIVAPNIQYQMHI